MKLKNILLFALLFLGVSTSVNAQYSPPNIDFETGTTSNWQYFKGSVSSGPVYTLISCAPTKGMHTITSGTDTDHYGGFPIVGNGLYSLELGHDTINMNADRARYFVHVPTGGSIYNLIYHYAAVLENPAHPPSAQPRMEVKAYDSSTGLVVACDSFCFVSSSSLYGFILSTVSPGDVYYRPWTAGTMNLKGFGGHTIAVEFTIAGCSYAGHFGYGYIDMGCGLFATKMSTCGGPTVTLSGPAGYAHYRWCDSATMTTIDTTQNVTIPTPGVPTKYVVILTPAPGYGCPDTLYTEVIPIIPCSGTPSSGGAYAIRSAVCGDPDTLTVTGYSTICGLTYQWQSSPDNITWVNMPGATTVSCSYYHPYIPMYYRCIVTCTASGLAATSSLVYVPAIAGVGLSSVTVPPDTICNGAEFYVSACGASTTYNVASFYGDGTSDTNALTTSGIRHADYYHHYSFPGTYSIKQILYDGSFPVDSAYFSYNYIYCSTLPIKFYNDDNNNCINDSGETSFQPVLTEVDSNGIPIDTISATSGFYYLTYGGPGTVYRFKVISAPPWLVLTCPSSGILYDTIQPLVNYYSTKYFGYNCSPGSFDLTENGVLNSYLNMQTGDIFVNNANVCTSLGAIVTVNFSPKFIFSYSRPLATSVIGNTVTWNLSGLGSKPVDLYYVVKTYPFLASGDTVHTTININPVIGDSDTTNNSEIIVDTVRVSHDPNFILVSPEGCIPSTTPTTNLKYTISFENTGNDTAHNIYVMDTLPVNVDPHTLEIVDASAQMDIASFNIAGHNIVKFDFPGINLLDSTHKGQCRGMVMFNIKTRAGLADGTTIDNHAGIFFDINPVVLTNTVENIIGCPNLKVPEVSNAHKVELYPNPANDELVIRMDKEAYSSFVITDEVGQVLIQQNLFAQQTKVNIKTLPAGLYYITLKGNNGTVVKKFVKM